MKTRRSFIRCVSVFCNMSCLVIWTSSPAQQKQAKYVDASFGNVFMACFKKIIIWLRWYLMTCIRRRNSDSMNFFCCWIMLVKSQFILHMICNLSSSFVHFYRMPLECRPFSRVFNYFRLLMAIEVER